MRQVLVETLNKTIQEKEFKFSFEIKKTGIYGNDRVLKIYYERIDQDGNVLWEKNLSNKKGMIKIFFLFLFVLVILNVIECLKEKAKLNQRGTFADGRECLAEKENKN